MSVMQCLGPNWLGWCGISSCGQALQQVGRRQGVALVMGCDRVIRGQCLNLLSREVASCAGVADVN